MLVTLLARARESASYTPLFIDDMALELVRKIPHIADTDTIDASTHNGVVVRTKVMDELTRDFLSEHPTAIIINLGAGLCTRFYRVDTGAIDCYNIDLPHATELRTQLLPPHPRNHNIAANILDHDWVNTIDAQGRKVLIIAEGVTMFLTPLQIQHLLNLLSDTFPGARVLLDLLSAKVVGHSMMVKSVHATGARFAFGVHDARDITQIEPRMIYIDQISMARYKETKIPIYKIIKHIPLIANISNRIGIFDIAHTHLSARRVGLT
ncbi:hypothetical protein CAQU_02755 [Corynebacterium aquilae DSM 44791]|uniref:Methyltransferase n=2 Tax=Corynebacterium aquilae TaxID=203263 RepID=A0A1L7CEA8_9CORY|nr:hypothetical protein CAQU_02755 [Corynebacterium aquilae DSM 44791]